MVMFDLSKVRLAVVGSAVGICAMIALVVSLGATAGTAAVAVAPQATAPPTITGTAQEGKTLVGHRGTWSGSPTGYTDYWLRCDKDGGSCAEISGANEAAGYVLKGVDVGNTIRFKVKATNVDGSTFASSVPSAVVSPATAIAPPANTEAPTISGTPKVGQALTASEGTWTGKPTGYTYAWQRCDADVAMCATIAGSTGQTHTVLFGDLGYRLRAVVTAKNADGSTSANSAITLIVQPAVRITNQRPTLSIVWARFKGSTVTSRFRICDDSYKNLTVLATDSRPGVTPYVHRFTTLAAPRPCGVYTRHWLPAARFRGHGKYTVTLRTTDKSGRTSLPARRTFTR